MHHSVLQVVIDQIWHSEIIIGSTSVDSMAWSQWPNGGDSSPLDMHLGLNISEYTPENEGLVHLKITKT